MNDPAGVVLVIACLIGAVVVVAIAHANRKAARERQRIARAQEAIDVRLNKLQATMEALPAMISEAFDRSGGGKQ